MDAVKMDRQVFERTALVAQSIPDKVGHDPMHPRIEFKVKQGSREADLVTIEVKAENRTLAFVTGVPLSQLCNELAAWTGSASDATPSSFVFSGGGNPRLLGTFRIEPRPVGWQFTSAVERLRHDPLPLAEFVTASAKFCRDGDLS
jgi:hypothetical protein